MNLKLGLVYLTGSSKPNQRNDEPKTITLGFWNEDSRGEPFRYARAHLRTDQTIEQVGDELIRMGQAIKAGAFEETPKDA